MRILHLFLAGAAAAALASGAAAQTAPRKPPAKSAPAKASSPKPAPEPPPPPYVPGEKVRTSDEVKSGSVGGAASTPLRDLNVVKTTIPDILLISLADPYARPPARWRCPQLIGLIRPLDDALGPDMDIMPAGDENLMDRGKSTALGVAGDLAGSAIIPFRGVVRRLTGAEGHDQLVQSAIIAGNVRRAYLKGLGEARGCMPPATPSHEKAGTPPLVVNRSLKPKYPTREPDAPQRTAGTPPPAPPR